MNLTLVCLAALSVTGVAAFVSRTPSARSSAVASIPPSLRNVLPAVVLGRAGKEPEPPPSVRPSQAPAPSAAEGNRAEPPAQALSEEGASPAAPTAAADLELEPVTARSALEEAPLEQEAAANDETEEEEAEDDEAEDDEARSAPRPESPASRRGAPTRANLKPRKSPRAAPERAEGAPDASRPSREWTPGPPIGSGTSPVGLPGGMRKMSLPTTLPTSPSSSSPAVPTPSPAAPAEGLPINPY